MKLCVECGRFFLLCEEDPHAKLCVDCFENSLEDYEERKRERIARENEY